MNLFEMNPYQLLKLEEIDYQLVETYQLTLPSYYVYQLIAIIHQKHPSKQNEAYLDQLLLKKEENDDFRHGVIDAFCEVVKAGVKKIAFSHATNHLDLFASDLYHAHACAKKYGISYYIEEQLIETCLFHNSGSHVIIFYSNQQDIDDYIALKNKILNTQNPTLNQEISYGQELGRLLSYSSNRIEEMIKQYYA